MSGPNNFAELMSRVREGDEEAFHAVLATYGDAIQREIRFTLLDAKVRRVLGDSDVFQSVVFRFYSGMRDGNFQLESPTDLVRLLKGIARTRIAELVRFWRAQRRDLKLTSGIDAATTESVRSTESRPEQTLEKAEIAQAIQTRLSPRDLEILQLRDDGLGWNEIAQKIGAPSPEAIRKQHERSLARIASELNREDQAEKALGTAE